MAALPRFVATPLGPIRGYDTRVAALADANDVRYVTAGVTFAGLAPTAGAGTVRTRGTVRLDRQPGAGFANLQIQVNREAGVGPGVRSSVGQVLVPGEVHRFVVDFRKNTRQNLENQLVNVTRSALIQSASSGQSLQIGITL